MFVKVFGKISIIPPGHLDRTLGEIFDIKSIKSFMNFSRRQSQPGIRKKRDPDVFTRVEKNKKSITRKLRF